MARLEPKCEILSVDEAHHSILVRFYTDEIKNHYETIKYPAHYENIRAGRPEMTDAQVEKYVRDTYWMGYVLNVAIPAENPPVDRDLITYVLAHVNMNALSKLQEIATGKTVDLSLAVELIGRELNVSAPQAQPQPLPGQPAVDPALPRALVMRKPRAPEIEIGQTEL